MNSFGGSSSGGFGNSGGGGFGRGSNSFGSTRGSFGGGFDSGGFGGSSNGGSSFSNNSSGAFGSDSWGGNRGRGRGKSKSRGQRGGAFASSSFDSQSAWTTDSNSNNVFGNTSSGQSRGRGRGGRGGRGGSRGGFTNKNNASDSVWGDFGADNSGSSVWGSSVGDSSFQDESFDASSSPFTRNNKQKRQRNQNNGSNVWASGGDAFVRSSSPFGNQQDNSFAVQDVEMDMGDDFGGSDTWGNDSTSFQPSPPKQTAFQSDTTGGGRGRGRRQPVQQEEEPEETTWAPQPRQQKQKQHTFASSSSSWADQADEEPVQQEETVFAKPQKPNRKQVQQSQPQTFAQAGDDSDNTRIYIKSIPSEMRDKKSIARHFEKFGKVSDIKMNARSGAVTIEFGSHESAKKAKSAPLNGPGGRRIPLMWYHSNRQNAETIGDAEAAPAPADRRFQAKSFQAHTEDASAGNDDAASARQQLQQRNRERFGALAPNNQAQTRPQKQQPQPSQQARNANARPQGQQRGQPQAHQRGQQGRNNQTVDDDDEFLKKPKKFATAAEALAAKAKAWADADKAEEEARQSLGLGGKPASKIPRDLDGITFQVGKSGTSASASTGGMFGGPSKPSPKSNISVAAPVARKSILSRLNTAVEKAPSPKPSSPKPAAPGQTVRFRMEPEEQAPEDAHEEEEEEEEEEGDAEENEQADDGDEALDEEEAEAEDNEEAAEEDTDAVDAEAAEDNEEAEEYEDEEDEYREEEDAEEEIPQAYPVAASPSKALLIPRRVITVGDLGDRNSQRIIKILAKPNRKTLRCPTGLQRSDGLEGPSLVGICEDMATDAEMEDRIAFKQIDPFELDPITGEPSRSRLVKKYRRPAAGDDADRNTKENTRTPLALIRTLDFLLNILDEDLPYGVEPHERAAFVRDRTRQIRTDFTVQRMTNFSHLYACEIIARFHILVEHQFCEETAANFDSGLNVSEMRKCLTTCKQHYEDFRNMGFQAPFEAEFLAYTLLTVENWKSTLFEFPKEIQRSPEVELAVAARAAVDDGNYARFFKLFEKAEPIMACALHRFFPAMRIAALKVLNRAVGDPTMPLEDVASMLAFDTLDFAEQFCTAVGVVVFQDPDTDEWMVAFGRPGYAGRKSYVSDINIGHELKRKSAALEAKLDALPTSALLVADSPNVWEPFFAIEAELLTSGGSVSAPPVTRKRTSIISTTLLPTRSEPAPPAPVARPKTPAVRPTPSVRSPPPLQSSPTHIFNLDSKAAVGNQTSGASMLFPAAADDGKDRRSMFASAPTSSVFEFFPQVEKPSASSVSLGLPDEWSQTASSVPKIDPINFVAALRPKTPPIRPQTPVALAPAGGPQSNSTVRPAVSSGFTLSLGGLVPKASIPEPPPPITPSSIRKSGVVPTAEPIPPTPPAKTWHGDMEKDESSTSSRASVRQSPDLEAPHPQNSRVTSPLPARYELIPIAQKLQNYRLRIVALKVLDIWRKFAHSNQATRREEASRLAAEQAWRNSLSRRLPGANLRELRQAKRVAQEAALVEGSRHSDDAHLVSLAWRPVGYTDLIAPPVASTNPDKRDLFWKLSLFVDTPSSELSAESWILAKLSQPSFSPPPSNLSGELIALQKTRVAPNEEDSHEVDIRVCVRKFDTEMVDFSANLGESLCGSSGLLYFFPGPLIVSETLPIYGKTLKKSLKRIFSHLPEGSKIPFCGLYSPEGWGHVTVPAVRVEMLQNLVSEAAEEAGYQLQHAIIACLFTNESFNIRKLLTDGHLLTEASDRLNGALGWLACHASPVPSVRRANFSSLAENLIVTIVAHAKARYDSGLPVSLVSMTKQFNSGIMTLAKFLHDCMVGAPAEAINWPAADFWDFETSLKAQQAPILWASSQQRENLKNIAFAAVLPPPSGEPASAIGHLDEALRWIGDQIPRDASALANATKLKANLESLMQNWFPSSRSRLPWHLAIELVFNWRLNVSVSTFSSPFEVGVPEHMVPQLNTLVETVPSGEFSAPTDDFSPSPQKKSHSTEVDSSQSPNKTTSAPDDQRALVENLLFEIEREKKRARETDGALADLFSSSTQAHVRITKLDQTLVRALSDPKSSSGSSNMLPVASSSMESYESILELANKRISQKRKLITDLRVGIEQEKRKARKLDSGEAFLSGATESSQD